MHLMQVEDELGQIFDGINVMVWGGRNQGHPRFAVAQSGDVGIHLGAGQLPPFAGFGPLGHLDFQLFAAAEVGGGDAEPARSDLLDGGAGGVSIPQAPHRWQGVGDPTGIHIVEHGEAHGVFPSFAAVALAPNSVHRHGQHLMGLPGKGPQTHAACAEAMAKALHALHLIERKGGGRRGELQQIAEGREGPALNQLLIGGEMVVARAGGHGGMERLRHFRAVHMEFSTRAVLHKPHEFQLGAIQFGEGLGVESQGFAGQIGEAQAGDAARRAPERQFNEVGANANRLKNLSTVITGEKGDANFGENFPQAIF